MAIDLTFSAEEIVNGPRRLTDGEFDFCLGRFSCLCIDFVITNGNGGVLFAKREIEPFKGFWTLPGGIWRRKEPINDAIARLLNVELKIQCTGKKLIGYIHHIHDGPIRSSVSLVFQITYQGEISGSDQGREFQYITDFSADDIQPYQAEFFRDNLVF